MSTAIVSAARLSRWVAVMTLTVGVVLMHHVVGTHAHLGGSGNGMAGTTMLAIPAEGCGWPNSGSFGCDRPGHHVRTGAMTPHQSCHSVLIPVPVEQGAT